MIRGTTADPDGNITMEREALLLDAQAAAMAARISNGLVIAQVEEIASNGSLYHLVFAGTLTAEGDTPRAEVGQLRIVIEGRTSKFVEAVEQSTFNGPLAAAKGTVCAVRDRALRIQAAARGAAAD